MKLEKLTPMLRTKNLKGTVEFYTQVLGFECGAFSEEWAWASLGRDGASVMLRMDAALMQVHSVSERQAARPVEMYKSQAEITWNDLRSS